MDRTRVVIMGAAGRDFHDFNVVYRNDAQFEVVAFTASTQIPGIAGRRYPAELAGSLYPDGIRIVPESELEQVLAAERVDRKQQSQKAQATHLAAWQSILARSGPACWPRCCSSLFRHGHR